MPRPKQRVSIFSLAKEFGVSGPTISKALSNSTEISDSLRQKVRARAKDLGFKPTRPRRKNFNICVVLDLEFHTAFRFSGYQEAVVEGVYSFCHEQGVEFSLYAQTTERLNELNLSRELYQRNADGAVVIGASRERLYFEDLRKNGFPFVCIFDGPTDHVLEVDNFAVGRLGFDHLFDLGHRKIAIARQSANRAAARDRLISFIRRAGERGLADSGVVEIIPDSPYSAYDWGCSLLKDWLAEGRPWTAVFCLAENVAMGVLSQCAIEGIRVPHELSVLTCDNLMAVQRAAPPLSVVDIPNEAAGFEAALAVWKNLSEPDARMVFEAPLPVTQVIQRASTAPPLSS